MVPGSAGSWESLVLFYKWKLSGSEQIGGTWDIGTGGRPLRESEGMYPTPTVKWVKNGDVVIPSDYFKIVVSIFFKEIHFIFETFKCF